VNVAFTVAWYQGWPRVNGLAVAKPDYLVACSNFVRAACWARRDVAPRDLAVLYNGVEDAYLSAPAPAEARDPHRLVYTSHPGKGIQTALAVLGLLRSQDTRFHLEVFGGSRLWGQPDRPPRPQAGLTYHGLVNQRRLLSELPRAGFSINLQAGPEAFGISLAQAMAAGVIVVASPIGAFRELVASGRNGFLIRGNPASASTRRAAAALITEAASDDAWSSYMRTNARAAVLGWGTIAAAWEGFLDWALDGRKRRRAQTAIRGVSACLECGGDWLPLADGYHCIGCGVYARVLP
jgi:glycosyltransferase involved in cell wall biosynthesis